MENLDKELIERENTKQNENVEQENNELEEDKNDRTIFRHPKIPVIIKGRSTGGSLGPRSKK